MITSWNLAQMFFNICRITKKKSPSIPARDHLQIHNGGIAKIAKVAEKNKKLMSSKTDGLGLIVKII